MARRVVGERKGTQLSGMLLAGEPRPLKFERDLRELPLDYRTLLTTWGPGVIYGALEVADPASDTFTHWQHRYRAHADYLLAVNPGMDQAAIKSATVIAAGGGFAILATRSTLFTLWEVSLRPWSTFADALGGLRAAMIRPPLYYRTRPSQRDALVTAVQSGNTQLADGLFVAVLEEESVAGMLALALALVRDGGPYLERALREAVKHRPAWSELARALQDRSDHDHHNAIDRLGSLVEPFDLFAGAPDEREAELERAVTSDPSARLVLLDHYEQRGRRALAGLVRAYQERQLAERFGPMPLSTTACDNVISTWRDAWEDLDIASLVAAATDLDATLRRAIVNWIEGDRETNLAEEPAAAPLLILALRSAHADTAARALVALGEKSAARFLWAALTHAPSLALARAHHELGSVDAARATEILAWLPDPARTPIVFCLLQHHAADDRVFEAALDQFVAGSPYTEKVVAKRKTCPRVEASLWADFEREEAKVLKNPKTVSYTRAYGVLSRFLAKLGNVRAKAAYQRFQTKLRMDRAAANRIDWDDL